jgi:hypothetical protein
MKQIAYASFYLLLAFSACGSEISEQAKRNAQECANSVVSADYDTLVRFTHPRIIEMMGGKENMIKAVKDSISQMKSKGVDFVSATVGDAGNQINVDDLIVFTIPQKIVLKAPTARITQESFLLGISSDKGVTWVFLDLGPITEEQFKETFPELSGKVAMPPKKKPLIE